MQRILLASLLLSDLLSSDPIKIYQALSKLQEKPTISKEEFFLLKRFFKNPYPAIRRKAISLIRKYPPEKEQKRYLYFLLPLLSEKNLSVLRELYKTLYWYKEEKIFPLLYKRFLVARKEVEILVLLEELSKWKNPKVQKKLKSLQKNHKSLMVRKTCQKLLEKYY